MIVSIAGRPIGWSQRQASLGFKAGGHWHRGHSRKGSTTGTHSDVVSAIEGYRSSCYENNVTEWLKQALDTGTRLSSMSSTTPAATWKL